AAGLCPRGTGLAGGTARRTERDRRVRARSAHVRDAPATALEQISTVLGIDVEREQLDAIAEAKKYSRVPSSRKGNGREIRRAQPGAWANHMSRQEIIEMHEILAPKLDELGYLRPGAIPAKRRRA